MSFPYSPRLEDVKIESLQTQLDHLNLMRLRHMQWMSSANDPAVKDMHSHIVAQIKEITEQYNGLLVTLQH